jgi:hypothetical protein
MPPSSRAPPRHSSLPRHRAIPLRFGRIRQAESMGERACIESAVGSQDRHEHGVKMSVLLF